ncbi:MAG: hypothetical protein QXJ23_09695 [Thermofilum sp.]
MALTTPQVKSLIKRLSRIQALIIAGETEKAIQELEMIKNWLWEQT